MHQGTVRTTRLVTVAVAVFAAVGVIAPAARDRVDAAQPASTYEVFTGSVEDFYHVPDPLPTGAPGRLIRVQTVAATADATTMRIMYHSIDGAGRDRAVTGTMTFPNGPAPTGGWPVMSIANGTVGLGPQCAPSRSSRGVYDFGIGGVAVASDYIGEGPVGEVQAYLSRASEGHSVLDAVRAARNYADAHAGSRFVVLGGSQGGHGALSTSELATTYAPELDLLGTVALAPAAMFDRTYGALDEIVTKVVTAMGIVGLSTEHPEIDLADYGSPAALAAFAQMRTECRDQIISTVLGVPGEFFSHDPRTTEPAKSIMRANDVGNVAAPSPVFLIQGTADVTVDPRRTDDLFARMCRVGQVTEYLKVPEATHENVTQMAMDRIQDWLAARLAGEAAPDTCGEAPPVTTTTTTTAPPTTVPPVSSTVAPTTSPAAPSTTAAVAAVVDGHGSNRSGSTGGDGSLATTGARSGLLGAVALGCCAAGAVLVAAERRRFSRR